MALNLPTANHINANVAGFTSNEVPVATASPATHAESLAMTIISDAGSLGSTLFGHGFESHVATPIEKASDSVIGALGGLTHINRNLSQFGQAPLVDGTPTTGTAAVMNVQTPSLTDTIRGELSKLTSRFSIKGLTNGGNS